MSVSAPCDSFGLVLLLWLFEAVPCVSCCHSSGKLLVMLITKLIFLVIRAIFLSFFQIFLLLPASSSAGLKFV